VQANGHPDGEIPPPAPDVTRPMQDEAASIQVPSGLRQPRRPRQGLSADGRLKSGKLAGLSMSAAIWVMSWPVLVDSLLTSFVGLTDTVLAAGISESAADAIGGAAYIGWFIALIFMALDVGATALISRAVGGGKMAVANAAVGQMVLLASTLGVAVGLFVALMAPPIATLLALGDEARDAFIIYLLIIASGVPFMAILYAGIACLRGAGDTFRPMRAMILVNIVNITTSWILAGVDIRSTRLINGELVTRTILENPFGFDLGIAGIAIGTILGHAAGVGLILTALIRGKSGISLKRRRLLRPHWHTMRRIVRIGIPNFFETFGMWIGNFLVIMMVGWLGAGYLGAHIVTIRIEAFSFQPGFAMGIAAAALAGQYLGAGSPAHARRAALVCTGVACIIMGIAGVLFMVIPHTLVGIFSPQPTHLEIAPRLLFIIGIVQIPFAVAIVLRSAMRGAGDVKFVMWITWITTYGVRLPLAYLLCGVAIPIPASLGGGEIPHPLAQWIEPSLAGLWVGLGIELIIRAILFTLRFLHGGWTKARV
jgi:putative MATE family efflux protein